MCYFVIKLKCQSLESKNKYLTNGKRFRLFDDSFCLYIRTKSTKGEQEEKRRRNENITESTATNSKHYFSRIIYIMKMKSELDFENFFWFFSPTLLCISPIPTKENKMRYNIQAINLTTIENVSI